MLRSFPGLLRGPAAPSASRRGWQCPCQRRMNKSSIKKGFGCEDSVLLASGAPKRNRDSGMYRGETLLYAALRPPCVRSLFRCSDLGHVLSDLLIGLQDLLLQAGDLGSWGRWGWVVVGGGRTLRDLTKHMGGCLSALFTTPDCVSLLFQIGHGRTGGVTFQICSQT